MKQKIFEEITRYKNEKNEDSWIRAVAEWAESLDIPVNKLKKMLPVKLIEMIRIEAEKENLLKTKTIKKIDIGDFFKRRCVPNG